MTIKTYETCQIETINNIMSISFKNDKISKEITDNIIFFEFLVKKGDTIKEDTTLLTVEVMKGTQTLQSPISGKIIEINNQIQDKPELLQDNPTTWLIKVKQQ